MFTNNIYNNHNI